MGDDTAKLLAMVNQYCHNVKDSRWLQLEVCREFQRGQCSRTDVDCKFAHPPPHVEVQNGKVTACYDSIKGRCQRDNPKCKYLHPPQHLKDQLLVNGRNNLAVRNMLTQLGTNPVGAATAPAATIMNPMTAAVGQAFSLPAVAAYSPYYALSAAQLYPGLVAATSPEAAAAAMQVPSSYPFANFEGLNAGATMFPSINASQMNAIAVAHSQSQPLKVSRSDRIEVCREFLRGSCQRSENDCKFAHPAGDVEKLSDGTVIVCMDFIRNGGACNRDTCRYFHPPSHLQASLKASATRSTLTSPPVNLQSSVAAINGSAQLPVMAMCSMNNSMPAAAAAALAEFASINGHGQNTVHLANVPGSAAQSISPLHASAVSSLPVNAAMLSAMVASSNSPLFAVANGKKRSLEDSSAAAAAANADSFLLAAALGFVDGLSTTVAPKQRGAERSTIEDSPLFALQQPMKRIATEKSGVPMYQPVTALSNACLQYPAQFAYPLQLPAATPLSITAQDTRLTALHCSPDTASFSCPPARISNNAASVAYFDETGQLLDTLPVCRDFKQNHCDRVNCRYVHLTEDYVEVSAEGKVTVCRDFAKGKCQRNMCKYYHIPALSSGGLQLALDAPAVAAVRNLAPILNLAPSPAGFMQQLAPTSLDAASLALLLSAQRQQQQQQSLVQSFSFLQALNSSSAAGDNNLLG